MDTYKADQNEVVEAKEEPEAQVEEQTVPNQIIDEDTEQPVRELEVDRIENLGNVSNEGPFVPYVPEPPEPYVEGKIERHKNVVRCTKDDRETDVEINLDTLYSLTRHGGGEAKVGWGDTKWTLTVSYDKFSEVWEEYRNEK